MTRPPTRYKRVSRLVRVGPTPYGRGVFARRRFSFPTEIAELHGTIIRKHHYSSAYAIDLGAGQALEPAGPLRYLNHSCQPNCELVDGTVWNEEAVSWQSRTLLMTLALVGAGEQLTIDYAWPASCAIPCLCGQPHCRGWIVAQDERDQILSLR